MMLMNWMRSRRACPHQSAVSATGFVGVVNKILTFSKAGFRPLIRVRFYIGENYESKSRIRDEFSLEL